MKLTRQAKRILDNYAGDNPGVRSNIARFLMTGKLAGTGKMVILPVDQGMEHGPARSFSVNPPGYDPLYHHQLAIDAGLNGYAAPLGALECSADAFPGEVPTILKVNHATSVARNKDAPDQAVFGSVDDALRLGCSAIGFTIYPGSDAQFDMYEEIAEMCREAKAAGLASVVWSYPRGGNISKAGETGMDIAGYAAYIACALGAHIVKVKLPSDHLEQKEAQDAFAKGEIPIGTMAERVSEVVRSCMGGRRIVIFSGGAAKGADSVYDDARAIRDGGGNGLIIGRNTFQRERSEAITLLDTIIKILKGKED